MSFEALLGNEQLKMDLSGSLRRGNFSHCYLISGPEGSGKHTLAGLLTEAILCQSQEKPCHTCPACRKVRANTHPDAITVDDPEHKTVTVKVVRQAREDVYILPNESDHKIYIFPRAQDLGLEGQNALLKVLEEPPAYAVFLLLADNPEKLLPTVRSRCRELKLQPLPEKTILSHLRKTYPDRSSGELTAAAQRSGGFLGQAIATVEEGSHVPPQTEGFVQSFARRDALGLTQVLVPMEKWKRDALIPLLESWLRILEEALASTSGGMTAAPLARTIAASRSSRDIYTAITHIKKALLYARSNVSPGAICGWLSWVLRI